ncbi:MAG: hypothetical protein Q9170_008400, partial [Blastenia crenularia]
KDVTRRYTRSYTAKILPMRVDVKAEGKSWLDGVMKLFRYPSQERREREIKEDEDLAKREASEPMPRNIADFKNHPVFALERHLRRNEIVHPKCEVGRVNIGVGTAGGGSENARTESVYRRTDVLVCKTAEQWFRLGWEIRAQAQPVKRLPPARRREQRRRDELVLDEEEDVEEGEAGKALYAPHQTALYTPPPIPASGHPIPRNAFGNLDIYTPSMVPARGYHSTHPLTAIAAKTMGIDAVDAVTGFTFSGRRGKAVITGAVVLDHWGVVKADVGIRDGRITALGKAGNPETMDGVHPDL